MKFVSNILVKLDLKLVIHRRLQIGALGSVQRK